MAYAINKITATASDPSVTWRQDAFLDAPVLAGPADSAAFCPPFSPLKGALTGIRLDWNAVTGAGFYVVQLSQGDQSFQGPLSQGIRTTNTYLDLRYLTHIRVNQPIFWRVFAYTLIGGASVASAVRKVTLACPDFNAQGAAAESPGAVSPISCDSLGTALEIKGETTLGFGDTGRYTVDVSYDCEHYDGADVDVTSITWSTKTPSNHRVFTNTPIKAGKAENYYDLTVEQGPVPYLLTLTCEVTFEAVKVVGGSPVVTSTTTCSKTISIHVGGRADDRDLIWVRNDFAFALSKYAPVGVDMVIPSQHPHKDVADGDRTYAWEHQHVYSCTKPEARHYGRWAVLQQTLQPGETGRAVISGNVAVHTSLLGSAPVSQRPDVWGLNPTNPFFGPSSSVYPHAPYFDIAPHPTFYGSATADKKYDVWAWYTKPLAVADSLYSEVEALPGIAALPKATLFEKHYRGYPDAGWSGSTSFICTAAKWVPYESDCPDGSSSIAFPEFDYIAANLPSGSSAYGLSLPCTEGSVVHGVPCVGDAPNGEITLSREQEQARPNTCMNRSICVRECQDTGGGVYEWVETHSCKALYYDDAVQVCQCPSIDETAWPCSERSQPRMIVRGCRPPNTTTNTSTSSTSTTNPPCTNACAWYCGTWILDGDQGECTTPNCWLRTSACANIGCDCNDNSLPRCAPELCGTTMYTPCSRAAAVTTTADPATTTTTNTTTSGTTSTSVDPSCASSSGSATWVCGYVCKCPAWPAASATCNDGSIYHNTLHTSNEVDCNETGTKYCFGWYLQEQTCRTVGVESCCPWPEHPTGPCAELSDVGTTEVTGCSRTPPGGLSSTCDSTTTSSTSSTTTTSAYPCSCEDVDPAGSKETCGTGYCFYDCVSGVCTFDTSTCTGEGSCDVNPHCTIDSTFSGTVSQPCCCPTTTTTTTTTTNPPTTTTGAPSTTTTTGSPSTTTGAPSTTTTTGSPSSTTGDPSTTTTGSPSSSTTADPSTTTTTLDPCTEAQCMWGCQDPGDGYQWVQQTFCSSPCSCTEPSLPCFDGSSPGTANTSCEV